MRQTLQILSTIGLISLGVNAWADAPGGFNSILQASASGPATSAGQPSAQGAAIKGLPASLGGSKASAHPATNAPAQKPLLHTAASAGATPPPIQQKPSVTPPSTVHAPTAVATHPAMPLAPQRPIGVPMSLQPSRIQPDTAHNVPSKPMLELPQTTSPLRPTTLTPNPAATGYVNPFVGQPGVIENLSNRLAVIKLKNAIAKAKASGAKYRSEYATLSQNNSPQVQALSQSVTQIKASLAQLQSMRTAQARMAQIVQRKKAHPSMTLVGIIHNNGEKYALLQVGKQILTLMKGAAAGHTTIQSIGTDSIQMANGVQLRVSPNAVGHYASTSWKGTQAGGGIIPPQSAISAKLMNEARQSGVPLPGNNAAQMIRFPTPGIQP